MCRDPVQLYILVVNGKWGEGRKVQKRKGGIEEWNAALVINNPWMAWS